MKTGGLGRFLEYLADPKYSWVIVVAGVSRLIIYTTIFSGVGSITISALT